MEFESGIDRVSNDSGFGAFCSSQISQVVNPNVSEKTYFNIWYMGLALAKITNEELFTTFITSYWIINAEMTHFLSVYVPVGVIQAVSQV